MGCIPQSWVSFYIGCIKLGSHAICSEVSIVQQEHNWENKANARQLKRPQLTPNEHKRGTQPHTYTIYFARNDPGVFFSSMSYN